MQFSKTQKTQDTDPGIPFQYRRSSYEYDLPKSLIAQYPLENRSDSRMLHLNRSSGAIAHTKFSNIVDVLQDGDLLIINRTKVIPARIFGKKTSGGQVEIFLLNHLEGTRWECMVRPSARIKGGTRILIGEGFEAVVGDRNDERNRVVDFEVTGDFWEKLGRYGKMPLPPYIEREAEEKDQLTYQTVYSEQRGSVAAPTAGLHFTPELMGSLRCKGVQFTEVILHVGLGTFRPVRTEDIRLHRMHSEFCIVPPQTADAVNRAKRDGRRALAVGTTSMRTLESFSSAGELQSGEKWTDLFVYPGKQVTIPDGMITNFHMPGSTLLMLVSAFAGYDNIMKAYHEAVEMKYRFFSYGDAMLIL